MSVQCSLIGPFLSTRLLDVARPNWMVEAAGSKLPDRPSFCPPGCWTLPGLPGCWKLYVQRRLIKPFLSTRLFDAAGATRLVEALRSALHHPGVSLLSSFLFFCAGSFGAPFLSTRLLNTVWSNVQSLVEIVRSGLQVPSGRTPGAWSAWVLGRGDGGWCAHFLHRVCVHTFFAHVCPVHGGWSSERTGNVHPGSACWTSSVGNQLTRLFAGAGSSSGSAWQCVGSTVWMGEGIC